MMNAKESYNRMIDIIESGVNDTATSEEILNQLRSQYVCDRRTLGEVFKFLTGMPVIEYIKQRRMMRAYLCLAKENGSIDEAINYSGLDNNSSFDKKFRSMFGLTPREIKRGKDMSLYQTPLTWEIISGMESDENVPHKEQPSQIVLRFGIEKAKLDKYEEAMELQALYGFSDPVTEIAFEFASKCGLTLSQAFKAIDGCMDVFFDSADFSTAYHHFSHEAAKASASYPELWDAYINNIYYGMNFIDAFDHAKEIVDAFAELIGNAGSYEEYLADEAYIRSIQEDPWRFDELNEEDAIKPWNFRLNDEESDF